MSDNELTTTALDIAAPALLYTPAEGDPTGLVLLHHTGYGHKADERTVAVAASLASRLGLASLSLDGPIHGERRADGGLDPDVVKSEWRAFWHADPGIDSHVEEWIRALEALPGNIRDLPRGVFGLSMGTLYGLPLAADPRAGVTWAVLGMWGVDNIAGPRLLSAARKITVPVIHYHRWDDQIFNRVGSLALFDALPAEDKTLVIEPGVHRQPDIDTATDFVARISSRARSAQPIHS